jgi:sec-independent protein translocase protein TatB
MFDIGFGEFAVIIVLAVLLFGPEKIPPMARKVARVIHFLKNVANRATDEVKAELGPEYSDLTPADLHPKAFIQKVMTVEAASQTVTAPTEHSAQSPLTGAPVFDAEAT